MVDCETKNAYKISVCKEIKKTVGRSRYRYEQGLKNVVTCWPEAI
jgi:hypothetical protein